MRALGHRCALFIVTAGRYEVPVILRQLPILAQQVGLGPQYSGPAGLIERQVQHGLGFLAAVQLLQRRNFPYVNMKWNPDVRSRSHDLERSIKEAERLLWPMVLIETLAKITEEINLPLGVVQQLSFKNCLRDHSRPPEQFCHQ